MSSKLQGRWCPCLPCLELAPKCCLGRSTVLTPNLTCAQKILWECSKSGGHRWPGNLYRVWIFEWKYTCQALHSACLGRESCVLSVVPKQLRQLLLPLTWKTGVTMVWKKSGRGFVWTLSDNHGYSRSPTCLGSLAISQGREKREQKWPAQGGAPHLAFEKSPCAFFGSGSQLLCWNARGGPSNPGTRSESSCKWRRQLRKSWYTSSHRALDGLQRAMILWALWHGITYGVCAVSYHFLAEYKAKSLCWREGGFLCWGQVNFIRRITLVASLRTLEAEEWRSFCLIGLQSFPTAARMRLAGLNGGSVSRNFSWLKKWKEK